MKHRICVNQRFFVGLIFEEEQILQINTLSSVLKILLSPNLKQ